MFRNCWLLMALGYSVGWAESLSDKAEALVNAAYERTHYQITYDGRYMAIEYPGGDVPASIGVCTDVIIRAYRKLGIDLQQLVHEDMTQNFAVYPNNWGLSGPDSNIDHRRVPNLQAFFTRHGESLPITNLTEDYLPGDIVTWMLPGNLPHIGIVVDETNEAGEPMIVHNVGAGPKKEFFLFRFPITGHYRYFPHQK